MLHRDSKEHRPQAQPCVGQILCKVTTQHERSWLHFCLGLIERLQTCIPTHAITKATQPTSELPDWYSASNGLPCNSAPHINIKQILFESTFCEADSGESIINLPLMQCVPFLWQRCEFVCSSAVAAFSICFQPLHKILLWLPGLVSGASYETAGSVNVNILCTRWLNACPCFKLCSLLINQLKLLCE